MGNTRIIIYQLAEMDKINRVFTHNKVIRWEITHGFSHARSNEDDMISLPAMVIEYELPQDEITHTMTPP